MIHFTVAKNTVYQFLTKSVTSFIGFLITILIARGFGVAGFGDYVKITAYVALFFLALDLGLNAVYLQDKKEENFNKLFYFRIFISLVIFIAVNIVAVFLPFNKELGLGFSPYLRMGIFIYSFSIFTQGILFSASGLFQKQLNYLPYLISVALGSVLNLVMVFVFIRLNFPLIYTVSAFVLSGILTSVVAIFYVRKKILPVSFDFEYSKNLFTKAIPIGLMLIFNLIYFRADIFLLSLIKPSADVGIYGIAYKFFDFLIAVPLFLSNALYPFLLLNKGNSQKFFLIIKSYSLIFFIFSIAIILPFWFLSPLLSLIKQDFVPAIIPFRILLLALPFFFLTSFLQWILISLEKQKFLALVYFASTIINIGLNLIFIPQWSYLASAVITGFCEAGVFIILVYKVYSVKISLERKINE
jgi:O-antigen/teichoic acid export membrane protein